MNRRNFLGKATACIGAATIASGPAKADDDMRDNLYIDNKSFTVENYGKRTILSIYGELSNDAKEAKVIDFLFKDGEETIVNVSAYVRETEKVFHDIHVLPIDYLEGVDNVDYIIHDAKDVE